MEEMRGKVISSDVLYDQSEGGGSSKMILRQKPHRKLLSGLKLFETVKASAGNCAGDPWMRRRRRVVSNGEEDDEEVLELRHLPFDLITHDILSRLSIKTLLQFKSISKEWYSTISSHEFANIHLKSFLSQYDPSFPIECLFIQAENNYYLFYYEEDDHVLDYHFVKLETNFDEQDNDELNLVGSCNGLVCLANSSSATGYFYIWNPVTHHWRKISDPYLLSFNYRTSWGFAYVSSVDDYKVVRIVQNCSTLDIVAHVFSLKTGKWSQVYAHGFSNSVLLTKTDPGVLVDETLCWLMDTNGPKRKVVIVSFSLALEKFDRISGLVPRSITPWHHFLCVMGGRLSMCGLNIVEEVYISILKRPGEVESVCISPDFGVQFSSGLVGFTKTDRFFIISKNRQLALIDPKSSPVQHIPLITFREGRGPGIVSYNPSLISPLAISELKKN